MSQEKALASVEDELDFTIDDEDFAVEVELAYDSSQEPEAIWEWTGDQWSPMPV